MTESQSLHPLDADDESYLDLASALHQFNQEILAHPEDDEMLREFFMKFPDLRKEAQRAAQKILDLCEDRP